MKKSTLNPAAYGLTVDEATRLVRLHDMCAGMAPEDFDQMETAARSINCQQPQEDGQPSRRRSVRGEAAR